MAIKSQNRGVCDGNGIDGTVGGLSDVESNMPICYIDKDRKAFWLADDFKEFLKNCNSWKEKLKPCDKIEFFASKEEPKRKYEFVDISFLHI